jgi:hypothetical protein
MSYEDITEDDDYYSIEDFKEMVHIGAFTDYDGYACVAFDGEYYDTNLRYAPSQINKIPSTVRGVVWFNR